MLKYNKNKHKYYINIDKTYGRTGCNRIIH